MMHITEYHVVSAGDTFELSSEITDQIKEGYQPYGPPFINTMNKEEGPTICQAMVKYETPGEKKINWRAEIVELIRRTGKEEEFQSVYGRTVEDYTREYEYKGGETLYLGIVSDLNIAEADLGKI